MRMMVYPPSAKKRLEEQIDGANAQMPKRAVKRIVNGQEEVYERASKRVCDGAKNTGKLLIGLYAGHYKKQMTLFGDSVYKDGSVPSLWINNVRAGEMRGLSDRTIRRHIKELKDVGFIVDYKFHGTKKDFEVWLSKEILFGVTTTQVPVFEVAVGTDEYPKSFGTDASKKGTGMAAAPSDNGTECPHKQCIETYGNNTITTIKVDNHSLLWQHSYGNTDSTALKTDDAEYGNVWGGAAARGENVDKYVDKSDNVCGNGVLGADFNGLHKYFRAAVVDFWKYAKVSLWKDIVFSESEWLMIADEITNNVYKPFIAKRPGQREFLEYHMELLKAVDVARKYFERNPERYPAMPYGKGALAGYFDLRNKRGFGVAVAWRYKNAAEYNKSEGERQCRIAIMHLQKHRAGVAPKRIQIKDYKEVLNHYLIKMRNYDAETQEMFLRRLASINSEVAYGRSRSHSMKEVIYKINEQLKG